MDLSRRDVLRAGIALTLGASGFRAAAAPVAGVAESTSDSLTATIVKGTPGVGGYRLLQEGPGEPTLVRTALGVAARGSRERTRHAVVTFAHLTDVHVCDAQSPMRIEAVDQYLDQGVGKERTTYRPQEMLTAQVAEAMVTSVTEAAVGPVLGRPLAFALQTGDNSDNSQHNEVRWNIDLLDGGPVTPDSGDLTRWEGVAAGGPAWDDPHVWHPDGPSPGHAADGVIARYGFPVVPGLLDAARRPFRATGLGLPWFTAFGNHDRLLDGSLPITQPMQDVAVGDRKLARLPPHVSKAAFHHGLHHDYHAFLRRPDVAPYVRRVTPDPARRMLSRREIVDEHFRSTGAPYGHGFTSRNRAEGTAYYAFDRGRVRFVVLDTVDPAGGPRGSLDDRQFAWLRRQLERAGSRIVVLASHHTSRTMTVPSGVTHRRTGQDVLDLALAHPQVVAWFNGHEHRNGIWARPRAGGGGLWEVTSASHVDWPQQSRLVEIADNRDGSLSIFSTMLDHAGPVLYAGRTDDPLSLAGLSRELSANDWQERRSLRAGTPDTRNVELLVQAPGFLG